MPAAPTTDTTQDQAERALPSLHDFFHPGGLLANSSLTFEHRPGQYLMARAIEQALNDRRHLVVEAGTGTGKTLAYLLPALRRARANQQRIIISTGTKNLQEQLYFKDIPFLESLLGPLKVCYMKGRANYLCRHKLYALRDNPLLSGLEEISNFHNILQWERTTETGDRAELDTLREHSPLWQKLDARSEVCLGQTCPNYDHCFITTMRRKALASEIIIVNHHLFFADLAIKQQAAGAPDAGILPEAAAVIFDEAHELEDVASQYFGVALSNARFDELARDTESLLRAAHASSTSIESATLSLRERSRLFFSALPAAAGSNIGRMEFSDRADFLESRGESYIGLTAALDRLTAELDRLREVDEAPGLSSRAANIQRHLQFLLESTDPNTVFWIERRAAHTLRNAARAVSNASGRPNSGPLAPDPGPSSFNTHLQATPIDVSAILAENLFAAYPTVVLTSATLTVAEPDPDSRTLTRPGFSHLKKRLGLSTNQASPAEDNSSSPRTAAEGSTFTSFSEPRELVVPSHFNYAKQALLYLPPNMPEPRSPDFIPQAAERIRRVLEITRGRAFCLFTSYAQMRELHDRLLCELPFPLLLHGDAPRHVLLQQFRETPNAVLFGTSSFWQGVDVQGEQLSCVIIDKLPFAVPSDPIMKARTDAITAAGGNAFHDLQVPQAVITLKQGFGRLIRSLSDRGVLVLLDPRVRTARYGRTFLDSLPPYRRTDDITDVESFFET